MAEPPGQSDAGSGAAAGAATGATTQRLFRALWEVGLDRRQLSIHEMLTDILEVVQVAELQAGPPGGSG